MEQMRLIMKETDRKMDGMRLMMEMMMENKEKHSEGFSRKRNYHDDPIHNP